jgi:PAS domain S-box-containing protein
MTRDVNSTEATEAAKAGDACKSYRLERASGSVGRVKEHDLVIETEHGDATRDLPTGRDALQAGVPRVIPSFPRWLGRLGYYGLALLFVAIAAMVRWTLGDVLSPAPFLVFYLAWVAAAAFGGLGPGLLATLASWLCVDLWFDPTPWHIGFSDLGAVGRLIVLMAGGLAVGVVAEKMRRSRIRERHRTIELADANRALRDSEARFRILTTNLSSGVALVDEDGKFTLYNPTFLTMFGLEEDSSIRNVNDQDWSDWQVFGQDGTLLHVDDHPVRKAAVAGQAVKNKLVGVRLPSGGDLRWMLISAEPITSMDGRRAIICTYHDVTEHKRAEDALRELNATLENKVAQRTAELRERARQFHLGIVSARCKDDETSRATTEQVKQLLVDAIGKSRSLSHELRPPGLAHSDLRETFEWLAEQMQAKHGLTVRMDVGDRIGLQSEPLKALLFKAAQELLFNVIKHARVRDARLCLRRRRQAVCLAVSDKGCGFDPRGIGKAAGLGLPSIRERVDLLGGRMKVRSAVGKGTTFRIVVPNAPP